MPHDDLIDRIKRRAADEALRADSFPGALPKVATPEVLANAERCVGMPFPPLLRRLYLEVANGGFGPGYGLLPIGSENDTYEAGEETLLGEYRSARDLETWPLGLLLAFDFGCAIWSCVDATSPDGMIVNMASMRLVDTDWTLASWFTDWVDGKQLFHEIHDPATESVREGINPFTKEKVVFKSPGRLRGRVRPPLRDDLDFEPR